jgi:hypothetical protein
MTPFDPKAEMTLELSRLTQEPSAEDRARNLAALRERLGLPVPGAAAAAPGATALSNTHPPQSPAPATGVAARAPLLELAALGTVTAALGVLVGLSLPRTAPLADSPAAAITVAAASAAAASPQAIAPAATSTEESPARPAPQAADARRPKAASDERRPRVAASRAPRVEPRAPELLDAVRLLRRARSALQKGEAPLSLGLLDELDERFPRDMLDEERATTRVLALCANGQTEAATRLATRLLKAYPRSIYTYRIEQSCAKRPSQPLPDSE